MTALSDNLPATKAEQQAGNDALADILAKIIAAPATAAKQDTGNTALANMLTALGLVATDARLEAVRALLATQKAGSVADPIVQVPGALPASGVTSATATLVSSTQWAPSFSFAPGRQFYLTISGSGSGTLTVNYSRDAGSTYAPEATGVDGSAPIIVNKVAYAGSPMVLPLSVSEAGVRVGVLPGALSGTVTATLSQ